MIDVAAAMARPAGQRSSQCRRASAIGSKGSERDGDGTATGYPRRRKDGGRSDFLVISEPAPAATTSTPRPTRSESYHPQTPSPPPHHQPPPSREASPARAPRTPPCGPPPRRPTT